MPQARPGHAQRALLARSAGSSRRRELPDAASEQGLRYHRHGRCERSPTRTKGTTDGEVPKSSRPAGDCQSPGGGNSAVRQWTVGWAGGRRVTSCPRLQTRQSKSMAGKWPGSVLTGCRGIVAADKAQAGTTFSPSLCAACRVLKDRPVSTQFGQCCSRLGVGRGRAKRGDGSNACVSLFPFQAFAATTTRGGRIRGREATRNKGYASGLASPVPTALRNRLRAQYLHACKRRTESSLSPEGAADHARNDKSQQKEGRTCASALLCLSQWLPQPLREPGLKAPKHEARM